MAETQEAPERVGIEIGEAEEMLKVMDGKTEIIYVQGARGSGRTRLAEAIHSTFAGKRTALVSKIRGKMNVDGGRLVPYDVVIFDGITPPPCERITVITITRDVDHS